MTVGEESSSDPPEGRLEGRRGVGRFKLIAIAVLAMAAIRADPSSLLQILSMTDEKMHVVEASLSQKGVNETISNANDNASLYGNHSIQTKAGLNTFADMAPCSTNSSDVNSTCQKYSQLPLNATTSANVSSIHAILRQTYSDQPVNYTRTNNTISACMVVIDDSIRLAEWIAYHYTVLPLGSLTIAIDPLSKSLQRPLEILDLWRDRIEIEVFTNDSDWMPFAWDEGWPRRIRNRNGKLMWWYEDKNNDKFRSQSLLRRQNGFILQCMRKYKRQSDDRKQAFLTSPQWLLIVDVDEFITYNYVHPEEEDESKYELIPGKTESAIDEDRRRVIPIRQRLPSMRQQITIADWLDAERDQRPRCWKLPGLFVNSDESTAQARNAHVPVDIDANHLMSLRFRKVGVRGSTFSKAMLDVSWGSIRKYRPSAIVSIHNPHKRLCGDNGPSGSNADYISSMFRINHYYSGTLEGFAERGRDRRFTTNSDLYQRFRARNGEALSEEDDLRPWIRWFVDKVGMEEVQRLLVVPLKERYEELGKDPFVVANRDNYFRDTHKGLNSTNQTK